MLFTKSYYISRESREWREKIDNLNSKIKLQEEMLISCDVFRRIEKIREEFNIKQREISKIINSLNNSQMTEKTIETVQKMLSSLEELANFSEFIDEIFLIKEPQTETLEAPENYEEEVKQRIDVNERPQKKATKEKKVSKSKSKSNKPVTSIRGAKSRERNNN